MNTIGSVWRHPQLQREFKANWVHGILSHGGKNETIRLKRVKHDQSISCICMKTSKDLLFCIINSC